MTAIGEVRWPEFAAALERLKRTEIRQAGERGFFRRYLLGVEVRVCRRVVDEVARLRFGVELEHGGLLVTDRWSDQLQAQFPPEGWVSARGMARRLNEDNAADVASQLDGSEVSA